MAYGDPSRRISEIFEPLVAERAPLFETTDEEGTSHRLWRVCEDEPLRRRRGRRQPAAHDRRRASPLRDGARLPRRAPRRRRRPGGLLAYDFAPVYLANRHDPGLVLFPTHRVVSGLDPELWERLPELLAERWELEEVADVDALERRIVAPPRGVRSFGLVRAAARRRCTRACAAQAPSALDVVAVETLVLRDLLGLDAEAVATTDRIAYRQRADDAAALVDAAPPRTRGRAARARRRRSADVEAVADAGRRCRRSRRSSSRRSSTAWSSTSSIRSTRDGRALARGLSRDARRRRRGRGRGPARAPGRRARARRAAAI